MVVVAVLSLVVFAWLTFRWFLAPAEQSEASSDAIVVLAGGDGERIERAVELARLGVAPRLIINTGDTEWKGRAAIDQICREGVDGVEVTCLFAQPDSTKGEAQTLGALATDQGWDSLTLVTSGYHLHRSVLRFTQCYQGTINPVSAEAAPWSQLIHEWLGTVEALVLDRDCSVEPEEL